MQLNYKEISKLKGTYLLDREGKLCYVKSVTKQRVVIHGLETKCVSTILREIFDSKKQADYTIAPNDKIEEFMEERYGIFLYNNYEAIIGLSRTPAYASWGGNGLPMAEGEVLKQSGMFIDMDYVDAEKIKKDYLAV